MSFLDFSNYDWETWLTFIQERWYVLVIGLIVVLIVVNVVKTVAKWGIIVLVVLGLIMYSGYSLDDVKNLGTELVSSGIEELKEIGNKVADNVKQDALDAMVGEAKSATYAAGEDGSYTVTTSSLVVTGKAGSDEVSISVKGAPAFKVKSNDVIADFIAQAQKNSSK